MPRKKFLQKILEFSYKIQDIYEYVSNRDVVFVEIPTSKLVVPRMTDKEVEDFKKTSLEKFYRGVFPLVLYVEERVAFPINSSLLQPYYTYLRYLATTQDTIWVYAIPLTEREVRELYSGVVGDEEDLPESFEDILEMLESVHERRVLDQMIFEDGEGAEEVGLEGVDLQGLFEDARVSEDSLFNAKVLSPTVSFFESYFDKYPAGQVRPQQPSRGYPKVVVLSGHTGIAKSAIVKQLEDESLDSTAISVKLYEDSDESIVVNLRPRVEVIKVGSIAFKELEEITFSVRSDAFDSEFVLYQNPYLAKFYISSDQFVFPFRKLFVELVRKGKIEINSRGLPVLPGTKTRLDTREALRSPDPEVRSLARVVHFSKPVVMFVDELDRNHALLVRNLTTSFIYSRSLQGGLTFYSAHIIAAWNRPMDTPEERSALAKFYITSATLEGSEEQLKEKAFLQRFEEVYVNPSDPSVYTPVIEYLKETFEGKGEDKLVGVEEFLVSLSKVQIAKEGPLSNYTLLYYLPPELFDENLSDDERNQALLSGFATFRSYERLLNYLVNLKKSKKTVNLRFVKGILGGLFPASSQEANTEAKKAFKKIFSKFFKENFGYDPYEKEEAFSTRTDDILEHSLLSGVPVALYSPPGFAKTSRAKALVYKANKDFFEKLRKDENLLKEAHALLASLGKGLGDKPDPDEVVRELASSLVYEVGSEHAHNPYMIAGANAPVNVPLSPQVASFVKEFEKSLSNLGLELNKATLESLLFSELPEGPASIVKTRVSSAKPRAMRIIMERFPESHGVVILDEFTRADFVTQGSFFDALSEGVVGGEYFPPDLMKRVHVIATGNYTSPIFGTSVSEIDGALVARFANFFQMDPTADDLDDFLVYLSGLIEEDLTKSGASEEDKKELLDYILNGVGDKTEKAFESLSTLKGTLYTMMASSERLQAIENLLTLLQEREWREDEPGYEEKIRSSMLSPRNFSQMVFDHLLPNWSPYFILDDPETLRELGLSSKSIEGVWEVGLTALSSPKSVNLALKLVQDPGSPIALLIKSLDPLAIVKAFERAYSGGARTLTIYFPYPGVFGEDFLKLVRSSATDGSGEDLEILDEKNYLPIDRKFVNTNTEIPLEPEFYERTGLKEQGVETFSSIPVASLGTPRKAIWKLSQVDWSKVKSKAKESKDKRLLVALDGFVRVMVLSTLLAYHSKANHLYDFFKKVEEDREVFFPGSIVSPSSDPELAAEELLKSRSEQKDYFLYHLYKIYSLYSRAKASALVFGLPKSKVSSDNLEEEIREDIRQYVVPALVKDFEARGVEEAIEKYFSSYSKSLEGRSEEEMKHLPDSGDISALAVARSVNESLNDVFLHKFGVSLPAIQLLSKMVSSGEVSEDSLPEDLLAPLRYYNTLFESEQTVAKFFGITFDQDNEVVSKGVNKFLNFMLGKAFDVHIVLDSSTLRSLAKKSGPDSIGSYVYEKVTEAISSLSGSLVVVDVNLERSKIVLGQDSPIIPSVGISFPGSPTTFAGIPVLPPELTTDGSRNLVSSRIPSLVSLYVKVPNQSEEETLESHEQEFVFFSVIFRSPIKSYFFKRESSRSEKEGLVILDHIFTFNVQFETGAELNITTTSRDEVPASVVEDIKSNVVETEEFEDIKSRSSDNYFVSGVVNDLELLVGRRKGSVIYGHSSGVSLNAPKASEGTAVVQVPASLIDNYLKATNQAILVESKDVYYPLVSKIESLRSKVYDKNSEMLDSVPYSELYKDVYSVDYASPDSDLSVDTDLGRELDYDEISFGFDLGSEQSDMETAKKKDDNKSKEKDSSTSVDFLFGGGVEPKVVVAPRVSIKLLSLLRMAIDRSKRSLA